MLVPRIETDLLTALIAAAEGELAGFDLRWRPEAALVVVMATDGYPGAYAKGSEIRGLAEARRLPGVTIFHAGTSAEDGKVLAAGGRVLGVTARAISVAEAQKRAYAAVHSVDWPEGFCRTDIGWRAIDR